MNELIDKNPAINVHEREFKRLLGYPNGHELEGKSIELADLTRQWYNANGKPWVYSLRIDDLDFSEENLKIGNVEFASKRFRNQLAEANAFCAMLTIVSAGKECEEKALQLWHEGKPDEYFFFEVYGSAVAEHLLTNTGARFCAWAEENNFAVLPNYSPGYPGWNVLDQKQLLELILQKKKNDLPGKINVFESGMLNPKKSMLAVFGITKNISKVRKLSELIPCETCSMFSCQYRKTPYKYSLDQTENMKQLQRRKKEHL